MVLDLHLDMVNFSSVIKNPKNSKIVFATMALGLFFLAGFAYESYVSYNLEIDRAKIETINLSRVLQEQVNASFTGVDLVLNELKHIVELERQKNNFSNAFFYNFVSERKLRLSFVKSFKVVDKNGNFVADDEGIKKQLNIRDRQYYQHFKTTNTNELIISKPVISRTSGIWVIVATRRLVDKKGNFDGLILGTIPLTYFKEQFEKLNLGANGTVGLFDNQLVAHVRFPWIESQIGKEQPMRKEYRDFLDSPKTFHVAQNVSRVDQVERLMTIRKLQAYPFVIAVGLSIHDFTLEWKKRTVLYGVSIVLLFSVFLYFLFIFLKSQDDLEDQRHQAIQASKLTSLGEMASGIAHEINNPLTIISALATRTKKNLKDSSITLEKSAENQDKIIATVDRIAKIIRGLRSFSRDSNGDQFGRKKVSEIIEMTLDLCAERLKDKGIDIKIDPVIQVEIECREVQIVQVLVNLLNNSHDAVQSMEEKWIHISTWEYGDKVYIRITDSGPGIEDDVVEKMMVPFYTTKEIGKGTGLGLSISKGIIEAHHGNFYYRKFDNHTSFVMELRKNVHKG